MICGMLGAEVAVERHRAADAVAVEHLHQAEHADAVAVVARRPGRHVGHRRAGPPEPAGTFSISEKNSMLGMTQSATWAPFGHSSRGRSDDRRIGKRTVGRAASCSARLLARRDRSRCATTSSTCITSEYLWCRSNRLTLCDSMLRSKQHSSTSTTWIAVRIGVDRGRAHAARRAFAADDQRLDAELGQMRHQRRAEEHAGALLGDDDVAGLRLELRPDGDSRDGSTAARLRLVAVTQVGRLSARVSPVE